MLSSEFVIQPTPVKDLKVGDFVSLPEYVSGTPLRIDKITRHIGRELNASTIFFDQGADVFLDDQVLNVVTNYTGHE